MFVKHLCPLPKHIENWLDLWPENRCLWKTLLPLPNKSRIGFIFDIDLSSTELNINRCYLFIKDYLQYLSYLKLLGQNVFELSVVQGIGDQHYLLTLTFGQFNWISIELSTHQWPSIYYQIWSFWGKAFFSYRLHKLCMETYRSTDIPTDMYKSLCLCLIYVNAV